MTVNPKIRQIDEAIEGALRKKLEEVKEIENEKNDGHSLTG